MVLVIGENITVRRFVRYTTASSPYVHAGGKIGVMVNLEVSNYRHMDAVHAREGHRHEIAAMRPLYLDKSDVDQAVLERRRRFHHQQARKTEERRKPTTS